MAAYRRSRGPSLNIPLADLNARWPASAFLLTHDEQAVTYMPPLPEYDLHREPPRRSHALGILGVGRSVKTRAAV